MFCDVIGNYVIIIGQVNLENIGAEDIVDGNPRLILGLIWTIILRSPYINILHVHCIDTSALELYGLVPRPPWAIRHCSMIQPLTHWTPLVQWIIYGIAYCLVAWGEILEMTILAQELVLLHRLKLWCLHSWLHYKQRSAFLTPWVNFMSLCATYKKSLDKTNYRHYLSVTCGHQVLPWPDILLSQHIQSMLFVQLYI